MKSKLTPLLISLGFMVSLPSALLAQDCQQDQTSPTHKTIEAQRKQFNDAIEEAVPDVIAQVLHKDVILITGTDSDVFLGREAQVTLWQEDFALANRAIYVRSNDCINVSKMAPVAMETGHWRGTRPDSGDFAAGLYAAKWRQADGRWLIESEVFTTLSCDGDFCPSNPSD